MILKICATTSIIYIDCETTAAAEIPIYGSAVQQEQREERIYILWEAREVDLMTLSMWVRK